MDPLRHPDLIEITRKLRIQYEQILQAEQDAAALMRRRHQTLRDRLIEAEDRDERVRITTTSGLTVEGIPTAIGLDYMLICDTAVSLFHIEQAAFE